MATAHDVAAYILKSFGGPMSTMKLQKLVYYAQAWGLVWDEPPHSPLFEEPIQAWADGPVVRALYEKHRGQYSVSSWPWGNPSRLTPTQRETVDAVLRYYGRRSGHWLSELTHMETPWRNAREGVRPGARSTRVIRHADMAKYYRSIS
jgi:uncharacterized phage-associated protein